MHSMNSCFNCFYKGKNPYPLSILVVLIWFVFISIIFKGLVPLPGAGIYTATKYGILGFMEALRCELRLSSSDYVRTTVANTYFMKTSGDLHLLSDAGYVEIYIFFS